MQSVVDRDGQPKTALAIILEEVLQGGVDEICVVVFPGDQSVYAAAAGVHAPRVRFVEQPAALGYGHAVHCVREFANEEPFLL